MISIVMKLAIIVVNGFDLALGMPTQWRAFREWVKANENADYDINGRTIKQFYSENKLFKFLSIDAGHEFDYWSDVEGALPKFTDYDKDDAVASLDEFSAWFENYLNVVESEKTVHLESSANEEEFKKGLLQIIANGRNLKDDTNVEVTFINFNYTSTLNKLLANSFKLNGEAYVMKEHDKVKLNVNDVATGQWSYHIHGRLNDESRQVGIGIDNERQLPSLSRIIPESKFILDRFVKKNALTFNDAEIIALFSKVSSIVDEANYLVTYGWSLGKSDERWVKQIVDRLQRQNNVEPEKQFNVDYYVYGDSTLFKSGIGIRQAAYSDAYSKFLSDNDFSGHLHVMFTKKLWKFPDKWSTNSPEKWIKTRQEKLIDENF